MILRSFRIILFSYGISWNQDSGALAYLETVRDLGIWAWKTSEQIGENIPYAISHNVKNAIQNISNDIKMNKNTKCTILFSPAAASFDQFSNFEVRGDHFKSLVESTVSSDLSTDYWLQSNLRLLGEGI